MTDESVFVVKVVVKGDVVLAEVSDGLLVCFHEVTLCLNALWWPVWMSIMRKNGNI